MKRAFDVLVAGALLVLLSPLIAIGAIAVWLTSRGPALHRSKRVGQDGRRFDLLKLRTMRIDAGEHLPRVTASGDDRITLVGGWLRRTKIDEIPQLVNVLRGEMSIVGPRPEDPHFVSMYSAEQSSILRFRPGITSPASVLFRHEESVLGGWDDVEEHYMAVVVPEKLSVDLEYFAHSTFATDLRVLFATARAVIASHYTVRPRESLTSPGASASERGKGQPMRKIAAALRSAVHRLPPSSRTRLDEIRQLLRTLRVVALCQRYRLPRSNLDTATVDRMQKVWANSSYASSTEYLRAVAQFGSTTTGGVVECGSGITTIVLALTAGRRGNRVVSLEHNRKWHRRMSVIARLIPGRPEVVFCPLTDHGEYEWYGVPADVLPPTTLVVCDGPPSETRGGRYGAIPRLREHFEDVTILLDDARRPSEQSVIERWTHEFGATSETMGGHQSRAGYAVIHVGAPA